MRRRRSAAAALFIAVAIGTSATLAVAGGIDTTIVSGPSGEITETSVSFEFEATNPATFQCRLDSSEPGDVPSEVAPTPWQACASPHTYADLALGPHSFEVRARGEEGGVDPSPAKAAFVIVPAEPPPPETTIVSGPVGAIVSSEAVFTFEATGAEEFECRLDLGPWIPCASPQVYEGLADGPHTFEVRAKNPLGAVDPSPAVASFSVAVPPEPKVVDLGPPDPVAGVSFNAEPVDGKVVLICPGEDASSRLDDFKQIPVGCLINARHGTINLTASKGSSGDTQAANFWGGVFVATQKAADDQPLLLKLAGRKMCERRKFGTKKGKRLQVRERRRRGSGRRLWGSGNGNYTTRGNYGSATVRGTIWLVRDRCDGSTLFKVKEGTVDVRDFVTGKLVTLEPGESYIAKAKIPRLQFD